jgi:hypothetical protein
MIRSLGLSAALLAIVLLVCAGSMSARTGGPVVLNPGSAIQLNAVTSAVNPSQILTIWANLLYTGGGDGYQDNDKHGPSPTPEPSTILSFGAALLIGGGVFYSRRLRRNRK